MLYLRSFTASEHCPQAPRKHCAHLQALTFSAIIYQPRYVRIFPITFDLECSGENLSTYSRIPSVYLILKGKSASKI